MESKLSPPSLCHLHLRANGHIIKVRQVSSSKMADQINKPGFQSWNIKEEQKKHFTKEQSESNPKAGARSARFYFF